ncbi:hypothetical protein ACHAXT_008694 [Thalassiosira profunda]
MDLSDPSYGVAVIGINEGNAAAHNAGIFSQIKSKGNTDEDVNIDTCVCIRDKIMSVNGTPCERSSFDDVVGLVSSAETEKVVLKLGRLQGSTVVNYYHGRCISARPGESYGFLAEKCGVDVQYECRTGSCQTCVHWMQFPDKERDINADDEKANLYERTIFHCVGKVPRGYRWLHVLDPYQRADVAD